MSELDAAPEVYVEQWPSGGWVVRLAGHPVPVSRHDTEEEALDRAGAYRRGLAVEQTRIAREFGADPT
jgi:hypothetical protein